MGREQGIYCSVSIPRAVKFIALELGIPSLPSITTGRTPHYHLDLEVFYNAQGTFLYVAMRLAWFV